MIRTAVIELRSPKVKIDIEVELRTKESVAPHKTIDLGPVAEYIELSICMVGHERVGRRWRESVSGQGRDYVLEHFGENSRVHGLCTLWKLWHLNGMRAGNRTQRDFLAKHAELVAERYAEAQRSAVRYVTIFQIESEFLAQHDLNPCDGYSYGSAWLVAPIPGFALDRIQTLVDELGGKFVEAQQLGQMRAVQT